MARKKRKAVKSPPSPRSVPIAGTGGIPAWSLPALGWLALVFSWLAALGGAADGSVDLRDIFDTDTLRSYAIFRDLFGGEGYPALGWWHSYSVYYFPDHAFIWTLLALGADMPTAYYVFPLMQVGFAAAGWILACDFLFGKSPIRRVVVLLMHAASFLILAWDQSQIFIPQMLSAWHYGTWACVPWLLWLSLRMLDSPRPESGKVAALVFAMAVVAGSNMLSVLWFAIPAALAASLTTRLKKSAVFIAVLAVGIALGLAVDRSISWEHTGPLFNRAIQVSVVSWEARLKVISVLGRLASEIAAHDTLEFLVILAFVAALCAKFAGKIKEILPNKREDFRPRLFVLLLIPISMGGCLAAQINHGEITDKYYGHSILAMRYMLPLFFFPLLAGWALLEWKTPRWRIRPSVVAAAACAAGIAIAAPKLARIDFAAMDPFATPFQKCFAENARRLEWTSGIIPLHFELQMFANPEAGIENYTRPWTVWLQGQSHLVHYVGHSNLRRGGKEVQFVTLNVHNDRFFARPPRGGGDKGCAINDFRSCTAWEGENVILSGKVAKGAFGEPAEIVECAGLALYHYDPPLRMGFSDDVTVEEILGRNIVAPKPWDMLGREFDTAAAFPFKRN